MDLPNSLFSPTTLFTFAGAVTATVLLPNVLATLVELHPRILRLIALVVALVLSFVMAILSESTDPVKWLVAFFNGLLIYLSALGANETLSRGLRKPQPPMAEQPAAAPTAFGGGTEKRKFFGSWF